MPKVWQADSSSSTQLHTCWALVQIRRDMPRMLKPAEKACCSRSVGCFGHVDDVAASKVQSAGASTSTICMNSLQTSSFCWTCFRLLETPEFRMPRYLTSESFGQVLFCLVIMIVYGTLHDKDSKDPIQNQCQTEVLGRGAGITCSYCPLRHLKLRNDGPLTWPTSYDIQTPIEEKQKH